MSPLEIFADLITERHKLLARERILAVTRANIATRRDLSFADKKLVLMVVAANAPWLRLWPAEHAILRGVGINSITKHLRDIGLLR